MSVLEGGNKPKKDLLCPYSDIQNSIILCGDWTNEQFTSLANLESFMHLDVQSYLFSKILLGSTLSPLTGAGWRNSQVCITSKARLLIYWQNPLATFKWSEILIIFIIFTLYSFGWASSSELHYFMIIRIFLKFTSRRVSIQ